MFMSGSDALVLGMTILKSLTPEKIAALGTNLVE